MKLSIAVTTYNGEQYIIEQLTSILKQTRKPDEVIICDDCSEDRTVHIIDYFIRENKLDSKWKIICNEKNKGFTQNFIDCARLTSGDIIFFCDQDDIWLDNKLETIERFFIENDNIMAISHKFNVIDEKGNKHDSIYNKYLIGNGKLERIPFHKQIRDNYCVGCTLAIKRIGLDYVFPIIIKNQLTHDVPIGILLAAENKYYIYNKSLMLRRVHMMNTSQPKFTLRSRLTNVEFHIKGIETKAFMLYQLAYDLDKKILNYEKKNLNQIISILSGNIIKIKNRKIFLLVCDLFYMNPMKNKLATFVNLLIAIFGKFK